MYIDGEKLYKLFAAEFCKLQGVPAVIVRRHSAQAYT
jgi:hypothetical protein